MSNLYGYSLDTLTGYPSYPKRPGEVIQVYHDLSGWSGSSSGTPVVTKRGLSSSPGTITVSSVTTLSNRQLSFLVSGGVPDEDYVIDFSIVFGGATMHLLIIIKVGAEPNVI